MSRDGAGTRKYCGKRDINDAPILGSSAPPRSSRLVWFWSRGRRLSQPLLLNISAPNLQATHACMESSLEGCSGRTWVVLYVLL
jgi:hypothetical protein